jgi:hypothetical protein
MTGHAMCENFTSCDGQKCVRWPGDAGAPCGAADGGDGIGCIPPVYCAIHSSIAMTGLCTALLPAGAGCFDYSQCQSQTCGLSGAATCGTPAPYCPQL